MPIGHVAEVLQVGEARDSFQQRLQLPLRLHASKKDRSLPLATAFWLVYNCKGRYATAPIQQRLQLPLRLRSQQKGSSRSLRTACHRNPRLQQQRSMCDSSSCACTDGNKWSQRLPNRSHTSTGVGTTMAPSTTASEATAPSARTASNMHDQTALVLKVTAVLVCLPYSVAAPNQGACA